ncbi:MAG: Hpt domain-containing protein [Candidatus Hydrogenedentota bacterium]
MTKEEAPDFDRLAAMEAVGGDAILLQETVEIFLEDTPGDIARLQSLLAAGDWQGAARASHSVKGAAATVGAARLRALALVMEGAAQSGDAAQSAALAPLLDEAYAGFRRAALAALWPDTGKT